MTDTPSFVDADGIRIVGYNSQAEFDAALNAWEANQGPWTIEFTYADPNKAQAIAGLAAQLLARTFEGDNVLPYTVTVTSPAGNQTANYSGSPT